MPSAYSTSSPDMQIDEQLISTALASNTAAGMRSRSLKKGESNLQFHPRLTILSNGSHLSMKT
ncbi:MAG: hypothetical protein DMF28_02035 [Verrucomicrobia bacterium]|nr:MAG: hypothetical protein DMF28_02035 [Verrucomicrobiota bacterium]